MTTPVDQIVLRIEQNRIHVSAELKSAALQIIHMLKGLKTASCEQQAVNNKLQLEAFIEDESTKMDFLSANIERAREALAELESSGKLGSDNSTTSKVH